MKKQPSSSSISRRESLRCLGLGGGGVLLWACGGGTAEGAGTAALGASSNGGASTGGVAGADVPWATGGTASMGSGYADPFPSEATACTLAKSLTEGPCTEAADRERQDISEGYTGLPTKLVLLVVDSSCAPLAGAKVKIWHTQIAGSYSGDTPNNAMCLKDQSDSAQHYFRGVQTSDATGRVSFDTCFPGWYSGRTVHIHFTVTSGSSAFTSQLVFDQALVDDVFTTHPEYLPYGTPDTDNASDGVLGNSDLASFTLETARQEDGVLLASKRLVVPL